MLYKHLPIFVHNNPATLVTILFGKKSFKISRSLSLCVYSNCSSPNRKYNERFLCHSSTLLQFNFLKMTSSNLAKPKANAGIIIIGDEILKGQVKDTNTYFLTQKLYDLGVKVVKISVVPDQVDIVAKEVLAFSRAYTYVLTSGGIGPTHDDLTFEAIAEAFGDQLIPHNDILEALKKYFKSETLTEGMIKLATIPSSAKLNFPPKSSTSASLHYPLVSVQNVFIFPGIPELLEKAFNKIACHIFNHSDMKRLTREHFLNDSEVFLATKLNALVKKYSGDGVVFGSYPSWVNNYYKVRLTVEASSPEVLDQVEKDVKEEFSVLELFDKFPAVNSMEKIQKLLDESKSDPSFVAHIEDALATMKECFERYNSHEVIVAFNGGKDCIVILHLAYAYLKANNLLENEKLHVLYVKDDEPFAEVTDFINMSKDVYNLEIVELGRPMKEGLQSLLSARPHIHAAILGTRNGDPNASSQKKFSPTDADWPKLMRVNPIINWKFHDIWTFIRHLNLPYPGLYDRGYTSLGDRKNTVPNPSLMVTDSEGNVSYKPAYTLEDEALERNGRH